MVRPIRLVAIAIGLIVAPATAQELVHAGDPVVRAVLFFSPTCPHCREVIQDHLPIFFQIYGGPAQVWTDESSDESERYFYLLGNGRLEILLINAATRAGFDLYNASMESHPVRPARGGVPRLIVGDSVLVGSAEIPAYFHDLIRDGLRGAGVTWPTIAGLEEVIGALPTPTVAEAAPAEQPETPATQVAPEPVRPEVSPAAPPAADSASTGQSAGREAPEPVTPTPTDAPVSPPSASEVPDTAGPAAPAVDFFENRSVSLADTFSHDPVGNSASVIVLLGMLASILALPWLVRHRTTSDRPSAAVPLVALIGVAVAAYLTYIEATEAMAVCGPVGDCNTVQQSEYATLFGVVPVGALGLCGFITIIAAWAVSVAGRGLTADRARVALFTMAVGGTLFSIYLTFLEPFVIGATCAWCLTSAIAITILMWLSLGPAVAAWSRIRRIAT